MSSHVAIDELLTDTSFFFLVGVDGYAIASRKTLQYIKFFMPQLIQILSNIVHISAYCRLSYYTNKTLG